MIAGGHEEGRNRPAEFRPLRNYFLIEVIPWFSIIVFFEEFKVDWAIIIKMLSRY